VSGPVRPSPAPAVEVEHVQFSYGAGPPVLRDVSFTIAPRRMVGVVGPNGGGKTTLLRLLLGFLEPDRGQVRILGRTPRQARRQVGYVPQRVDADRQFPITVGTVVLMGRINATRRIGPYSRADREAVSRTLAEVGLGGLERRPFAALSGGERQRVLVARALAAGPELLLLDEPAANLDRVAEESFYELLHRLVDRVTILLVSHDIGFVSRHMESVVCVNRTVSVHPTHELDGRLVHEVFGRHLHVVRHDHHIEP
jgi:zinc transport system ATP-binding protein